MEKMGLGTPEIDEIVRAMESDPKIKGVKLSGSGLGDCVIGWDDFRHLLDLMRFMN